MNEIKDAVDLFSKQTSTINGLWTVWSLFAACGAHTMTVRVLVEVIPFWSVTT